MISEVVRSAVNKWADKKKLLLLLLVVVAAVAVGAAVAAVAVAVAASAAADCVVFREDSSRSSSSLCAAALQQQLGTQQLGTRPGETIFRQSQQKVTNLAITFDVISLIKHTYFLVNSFFCK